MNQIEMERADENFASTNDGVSTTVNEPRATLKLSEENQSVVDAQTLFNANEMEKTSSVMSQAVLSKPSIMCRICLNNEEFERLLSPCLCKGTMQMVHQQCLEHWLSLSGLSHCELCLFHFATAHHLRYGMIESIRIWFSHPRNRILLQSDILFCMLLSIITFGLAALSMSGMFFLSTAHDGQRNQISKYWTETSIGVFLGIVYTFQLFAFVLNTLVVVKSNIVPWFRWWRRSKEIQLVIRNNQSV